MVVNHEGYTEALDVIKDLQEEGKAVSLLICGEDGVGKNEIAEAWARKQDLELGGNGDIHAPDAKFGCVIIKPGQGDSAGDFLGLPTMSKVYPDPYDLENGEGHSARYTPAELSKRVNERHGRSYDEALALVKEKYADFVDQRTTYSLPDFWPRQGRGILILDELNRGGQNTESALLEVVRERKLSLAGYEVPKGWVVIGLINPPTARFIGARDMDAAMESRFIILNYSPTTQDWLDYEKGKEGLDPNDEVMQFIAEMPQFLGVGMEENPLIKNLKPRPRRVSMLREVNEALKRREEETGKSSLIFDDICQGTLGVEGAQAFMAFCKTVDKPIQGEDVLKRFTKVSKKVEEYVENNKIELLSATNDMILDFLGTQDPKKTPAKHYENFIKYCDLLSGDQATALCRSLGAPDHDKHPHSEAHFNALDDMESFREMLERKVPDKNKFDNS